MAIAEVRRKGASVQGKRPNMFDFGKYSNIDFFTRSEREEYDSN